MSKEKCFCHFMGYKVKDSTAQELIEENKDNVIQQHNGNRLRFWEGSKEEYQQIKDNGEEKNDCLYLVEDETDTALLVKDMKDSIERMGKTLFEGNAQTGDVITIPDIDKYSIIGIELSKTTTISTLVFAGRRIDHQSYTCFNGGNFDVLNAESGATMTLSIVKLKIQSGENYLVENCILFNMGTNEIGTLRVTKIIGLM